MAQAPEQEVEQDYSDTPSGWARRWAVELAEARKALKKWHDQGDRVVKRYRDDRDNATTTGATATRWNLFTTNVETKMATLYGQTPKVDVSRRYADAKDDVARVASEMMERVLNADIESDGDTFAESLQSALEDRLLPGGAWVRLRYVAEFETVEETPAQVGPNGEELAPAVPATERKTYECVETDYVHWRDVLWSPARTWKDVRWVAFRVEMSRKDLVKRFGAQVGNAVPLGHKKDHDREEKPTPWGRADVWEIWDEDEKKVFWYCENYPATLDQKDDPYGLEGFWPCPRPMLSLATTTALVPKPEFVIAQDLYDEVDTLSARIQLLTEAVRVAGVYDKANSGLQNLLSTNAQNVLIPVDNWAMFSEKGGVRGAVDWMPLDQIVAAISALSERRMVAKDALYEVTGMADIMRGGSATAGASATEQAIKARFGSVRLQRLQDEFARFASDAQKIKAELIARHFDPQTILEASNVAQTADAPLAQQAVALIKSGRSAYRVVVKPEAMALQDFAQLKQDSMEVLSGMSTFFQAAAPIAQSMPGAMPFLLQILQWAVARLRGASTIEGVLDQAIAAAQQAAQQPQPQQPDPKVMAIQVKGQQDMAKVQADLQADLTRTQAEVQADAQREQNQAIWNTREAAAKAQIAAANRAAMPQPQRNGQGGGL